MYYAALFLSQGSSSWMHKLLCLCCHDLFYHPKTPHKREPFICLWQATGSIYFTLQHSTRCCVVPPSRRPRLSFVTLWSLLISAFLHVNLPWSCWLLFDAWHSGSRGVTKWLHPSCLSPKNDFSHGLYPAWLRKSCIALRCWIFLTRKHIQTLHIG